MNCKSYILENKIKIESSFPSELDKLVIKNMRSNNNTELFILTEHIKLLVVDYLFHIPDTIRKKTDIIIRKKINTNFEMI